MEMAFKTVATYGNRNIIAEVQIVTSPSCYKSKFPSPIGVIPYFYMNFAYATMQNFETSCPLEI
jgi:hypothetical protein